MTTAAGHTQSAAEHRIVFVRLPRAIDVSNCNAVLDSLAAALAGSPSVVVADGDGTALFDCAGVSALICAHRRAAAAGAQLRLVAASAHVQRIVKLTGAEDALDLYLTMDEALADITGASAQGAAGADAQGTVGADPPQAKDAVEAGGGGWIKRAVR